ncbi:hypothetical protein FA95DRAFT_1559336 [Auriscalpium vulgare]|uniref:Uncharacterized protein n=1 Tax=Auriscalpium vulgare TaxID=40419 RepID=A0ACB8RTL9_9AGAM|nr:hypothetical protein FA95DRAFT_1559336 [Auriscalpium vulgare]
MRKLNAPSTPKGLVIGNGWGVRAADITITGVVNVCPGKWYPVLRVVHGRGEFS